MQDIDLHIKKNLGSAYMPSFGQEPDMDYYFKASESVRNDEKQNHKRANRTIAVITALIIVAFTAGLVVGIKFAGGPDRTIVDPKTRQAMTEIGTSVSSMINSDQHRENISAADAYPRSEFPYVVRVSESLSADQSRSAANDLSKKGYTVILSKQGELFRLFVGPFRNKVLAENSLQKIKGFTEYSFYQNATVLKRM